MVEEKTDFSAIPSSERNSTPADKKHYFSIAMGSIRECQAILQLTTGSRQSFDQLDHLAASVYKLIHRGQ